MRVAGMTFVVLVSLASVAHAQPSLIPAPGRGCADKVFIAGSDTRTSPLAYPDSTIDVTYYLLNLRVWTSPPFLSGSVVMKARCILDTISSLNLDLVNSMTVDSVTAEGLQLSFLQFPFVLHITLNRPYLRNEMVTVQVFYHGTPFPTGFGSFEFGNHQGTPWVWSLSEPYGARDWWPCKDHPTDKADSVDIWVTCDAGLTVGSNGRLMEERNNGDGTATTRWAERYPIATYLVSVAITNYARFSNWWRYAPGDSLQILQYVLPEDLSDALAQLPKTVSMLDIFSRVYGLYPFIKEKYGHSEFGSGGAMEHQTMTSTTSFDEVVIAHELSHQWFGDLITCGNWQNLWLNEGFASYSESVYFEQMYGVPYYWSLITARMNKALTVSGSLFVQDTTVVRTLFDDRLVYSKGASVLHMLRHVLGDSIFFRSIRSYVSDSRLRYGTAVTEDFRRHCELISGRDLGYFFQEWVYGQNHPRYSYRWSAAPAATGYTVDIRIDQVTNTSNPSFFVMPVDLRFSSGTWDTTVVVFDFTNDQSFSIPASHRPQAVALDPDNWILKEVLPPNGELPASFSLNQNFPNPFNGGTTIQYSLPHHLQTSLKIFNVLGEEVLTLLDGEAGPGTFSIPWDGTARNGVLLPSGVYFCRMQTDGFSQTRKMVILR